MWQKILLQSKKNLPDRGFLTLEIIIATIVAFGFLMFSLQALAFAMMMKIQAQKDQRADQLIQDELARLGSLSSTLNLNRDTNCNVDQYDDADDDNDSYAQALWDALIAQVPGGDPDLTIPLFDDVPDGITLTLNRSHADGISVAPHRTLRIFYQVTSSDNPNEDISSRFIEIIPEEALLCP
ncbi:MAG: hypothetical protein AB4372_30595 [Xenococcus sp. (in: cyanobacteria)]